MKIGQLIFSHARSALLLALPLLAGACGDPTAVDLTFAPNKNETNVESLVSSLRSLTVVLDSPDGLYPDLGTQQVNGVHLENQDMDPELEIWFEVKITTDRLPFIRLERGGLPGKSLNVRVQGFRKTDGVYIAAGGRDWIQFKEGEITQEDVPFDLRPSYRAPRVNSILPEKGDMDVSPDITSILVSFSKLMNHSSIGAEGVFKVLRVNSSGETLVPARKIETGKLPVSGGTEISYAKYYIDGPLEPDTYHVRITSGALDESGRPLDDVPNQPLNQEFFSRFTVGGGKMETVAGATCDPDCANPLAPTDCGPGTMLDPESGQCVGGKCPSSCPEQTVCDTMAFICVEDCRINGTYGGCDPPAQCDQGSGLCVE